ncbi:hypothetical protein ASPCAL04281 [Aspergillus calidoustus]|uniref:Uncharacterized protein n=1 Tax=Aspergillus calidoustus TaxID=454130 RepID=A0A0U5GQT0_ASPCI|nr:hypothetical protein ASPCAL04281 [Aspergillus calidoustus]
MSATATLGWTLTNWGPVFTTYIPPSSCTTTTAVLAQTQYPDLGSWGTQCYNNDCGPYPGTDEQKSAILKNRLLEPYFSPGVACPTGWKSIGALARASDGPIASRGVFTVMVGDSDDYYDEVPYSPSLYDALGAILDEGETMVACCPSSATVGPNGGCYSTLPSQTFSTGCATELPGYDLESTSTTFVIGGTTTSGEFFLPASPVTQSGTITTTSFASDERADWIPISQAAPIYFVQPNGSGYSTSGAGSTSTSGSDEPTETETGNAARSMRYPTGEGSWGQIMGLGGVMAVSILAGMAMVLPW